MDIMKFVPDKLSSTLARQVLITQKNSPALLFGAGVVGVVATVVLASRGTLKLDAVLLKTQNKLDEAKEAKALHDPEYSESDYKQDVAIVYLRSVGSIAKLYGPAILVGVVSIGALAGSHHILTKRNAGLVAAYSAIQKGFEEYRQRVVDELGPEKDREFRYGTETVEVIEDTKKGPKTVEKKRVGKHAASIYARFFDDKSSSWDPKPEYNLIFLRAQQNWANDRLKARGHVTLNDVYDSLGIQRSTEGFVVGWLRNSARGDNVIDFGIFDDRNMDRFYDFVTGNEGAILLDFNVDGTIYDKI